MKLVRLLANHFSYNLQQRKKNAFLGRIEDRLYGARVLFKQSFAVIANKDKIART